jgi:hypothetical protein
VTAEHTSTRPNDDHPVADDGGRVPRAYMAPELFEYGTVAKLTQAGSGSVNDFFGMMRMMVCL